MTPLKEIAANLLVLGGKKYLMATPRYVYIVHTNSPLKRTVGYLDSSLFLAASNLHRGIRGRPEYWTNTAVGVVVTPRPDRKYWQVIVEKEYAPPKPQDITESPYGFPIHLH